MPIINNIVERAIYNRFTAFLETNAFFYKNQFGFRPKCSTKVAIAETIDDIQRQLNRGKPAKGLFMDLSKAFDCVNHEILLSKLEAAGIRGIALNLFKSYLSDRTISVKANGNIGKTYTMNISVPQGSRLGPVLYLIYVNDFGNLPLKGRANLFADDTFVIYNGTSNEMNGEHLKYDLEIIYEYFRINKLTLN